MGCEGCPYQGKKQIVKNQGPRHADIMIVGEAPHTNELKEERPFADSGRSGELLMSLLHSLKLERNDVVIANSIRCQLDKTQPKEISQAFKHCREHLHKLILLVRPRLIITLGEYALKSVLKLQKIMSNRGRFFELPYSKLDPKAEGSTTVFVTVHPAYVLRGAHRDYPHIPDSKMSFKEKLLVGDFRTLRQYIENAFNPTGIDTSGYREGAGTYTKKVVSFDTELTHKDYRNPFVDLLAFGMTDTEGVAHVTLGKELPDEMRRQLEDPTVAKVVVARPFDENVVHYKCGVTIKGPIYDLLTMAHVLDENYTHNLENVANYYTNLKNIKDLAEGLRKRMEEMTPEQLIQYNGVDVDATLRAFKAMVKQFQRSPGLAAYYKHFIMPVQDMFTKVSRNGMQVDMEALEKSETELTRVIRRNEASALHEVPAKIMSAFEGEDLLNKNAFVSDYLFRKKAGLKLKPKMVTPKTKAPAVTEAHLRMFADVPFVQHLLTYRKASKVLNTYIKRLKDNVKTDGRIYPNPLLIRTVTGRTVMLEPEIQTYPKRGDFAPFIRNAIVPWDGYTLCARDLSQSEIRIIGWLAQDPGILGALAENIDIHTKTARDVLRRQTIDKAARQAAKAVNFGFIYGMQAQGFVNYARDEYGVTLTLEEAEGFRRAFFEEYHQLPVYHFTMIDLAREKGYVVSPLGRRRRLPQINSNEWSERSEAERQAINFPVQSFSSDLGLIGMTLMQQFIEKHPKYAEILIPMWFVHDEIIFLAKQGYEEECHEIARICMESSSKQYIQKHWGLKVGYPIKSSGKQGIRWSEMKDI